MRVGTFSSTALAVLTFVAGCATTQPEVGMEAPGRPAVMWHSEDTNTAPASDAHADAATERQLLDELDDAERKGTNQLALASTLYNLAILRRQQGALAEAERLYRKALAIHEREQGPNHPDVAVILNNLAALKAAAGSYEDAQTLLERAVAIRQTALGPTHVLTAESLNNLALIYAAQGDAAAAEPLYKQAVAILEQTPLPAPSTTPAAHPTDPQSGDPQHGALARVLDNYAALLHDTGRDTEAEAIEAHARTLQAGDSSVVPP